MNAIRNDTTTVSIQAGLPVTVGPRTVDHRCDVRVHLVEPLRDLGELILDGREARGNTVRAVVDGIFGTWWLLSEQDRGQMTRVTAERHRQSLQRPAGPSALNRVVRDLAHNRQRNLRSLRKLTLV